MKKWTFGVDLGGTEIKFGLFDDQLKKHWSIPTNRQDQGAYIIEDIAKTIKDCCDEEGIAVDEIAGIGIVCRGGDSYEIKNKIVSLLSSTFNLSANKIFVVGS